jgi:hypothetical protein
MGILWRAVGVTFLLLMAAPCVAQDTPSGVDDETRGKMQAWVDQDANCANSSVSCHMRDGIAQRLAQLGWCNPPRWQQCAVSEERPPEATKSDPLSVRDDAHVITEPAFQVPVASSTADPVPPVDDATMDNGSDLPQFGVPAASPTAAPVDATPPYWGVGAALLVLGVLLIIYLLPTIVAVSRKHHNAGAIFALNLLLGWSMIGWIVALVWALTNQRAQTIIVHAPPVTIDHPRELPPD